MTEVVKRRIIAVQMVFVCFGRHVAHAWPDDRSPAVRHPGGQPTMSASKNADEHDSYKTAISLLIATITVTGAILAWRISAASGDAGGADAQGLAASLRASNAATNISTYLYNDLRYFADYQQHLRMAALLEQDAERSTAAAVKAALYEQAIRERNLASTAMLQVDPEYVRTDPATHKQTFDTDRYRKTQWAEARAREDLDSEAAFASADLNRNKMRGLVGVTVLYSTALFLLTAATITRRTIKLGLLGIAVPLYVAGTIIVLVLEVIW